MAARMRQVVQKHAARALTRTHFHVSPLSLESASDVSQHVSRLMPMAEWGDDWSYELRRKRCWDVACMSGSRSVLLGLCPDKSVVLRLDQVDQPSHCHF